MPNWRASESAMSFFTRIDPDAAAEDPFDETGHDEQDRTASRGKRLRRGICAVAATGLVTSVLAVLLPASASADPSANDWYRLRMCESSNNYSINTGNGYYGAYQFDLATWRSVGGTGLPSNASKAEQDKRALMLYHERGWQPWTCARIVGLTGGGSSPDSNSSTPIHTAHGWPGVQYKYGDHSSKLVKWQKQMRKRGATILQGTGEFGPKTRLVAKTLQKQNGLPAGGTIGPETWELAWTGKFTPTAATRSPAAAPKKVTNKAKPAVKKPVAKKPAVKKPATKKATTKPAAKPVTKPVTKPAKTETKAKAAAWPGTVYGYGEKNAQIAAWQKQMAKRGAPLQGTGEFGATTYAVAKALQKQNGLPVVGYIGPKTWALAWTGNYAVKAPAWPGTVYGYGEKNAQIAAWQKQMAKRGAPLQGTGEFGATTYAVAKALQKQNGLPVVGYIGPKTWALAWTGTYHR